MPGRAPSRRGVARKLAGVPKAEPFHELACKAAGRIWDRVTSSTRGTKSSIELPAVMRQYEVWGEDRWHVVWSSSTMPPDVEIELNSSQLTCKAVPQSLKAPTGKYADVVARHAARYRRLPADWADRICKSLRKQ